MKIVIVIALTAVIAGFITYIVIKSVKNKQVEDKGMLGGIMEQSIGLGLIMGLLGKKDE